MEAMLKMDSPSWELINDLQNNQKSRHKDFVKVNRLQEQIKLFREKLNKSQSQLLKINSEIQVKQDLLKNHRKQKRQNQHKNKFSKKSPQYFVWKNPKNFENLLEKKITKFSFGQSKNRDRRREIDGLRREKMMRERINSNLENEIEEVKWAISNLGKVVENLENKQKERRKELVQERRKQDDKSEIAKLGIKQVAERLQEENEKTRVDFFHGVANWGNVNPSGLGGSVIYNSDKKIKRGSNKDKEAFDEQVNLGERKKLTSKIKNMEEVLQMWYKATSTGSIGELKDYIRNTTEENTVWFFLVFGFFLFDAYFLGFLVFWFFLFIFYVFFIFLI
jgi:DNA repair exonuclease SbcCD ATPase subunit